MGSNAASNAASAEITQANRAISGNNTALNNELDTQKQVYQTDRQALAPYQAAGTNAVGQLPGAVLAGAPNAQTVLAQDPGYAFRIDQANQALQRMQAAGGGVGSGGALKAAAQYSQNLASNEYGNAFNRYMQANQQRFGQLNALAGMGQTANNQQIYAGANFANQSGLYNLDTARMNSDLLTQIGNAQASGYMGSANAWSGALGGALKAAGGFFQPSGPSAGAQASYDGAMNAPTLELPGLGAPNLGLLGLDDYTGNFGNTAAV